MSSISMRAVAVLLVGALATLVPLAQGSPPDPTWIAGLYDNGDHDDAVLAITDAAGSPAIDPPAVSPLEVSSIWISSVRPTRPDAPSRISLVDRAPPLL